MNAKWTALIGLIVSIAAQADVRIDYATQGGCSPDPAVFLISGSRLRVEHAGATASGSSLFDGLDQTVVYLDHAQRSFYEIEVDADAADYTGDVASSAMHRVDKEMAKAQAQIEASCKEMEKQGMACPMRGMDMQAMMQMTQGMQSGSEQAAAPPQWSDSGDDTIAGVACRWREQRAGERRLQARCEATPEALPLAGRDRNGFANAYKTLTAYARSFSPVIERFGGDAPPSSGLVLGQRCFDERGEPSGDATARFDHGEIDEALFEIPAGYSARRMDGG